MLKSALLTALVFFTALALSAQPTPSNSPYQLDGKKVLHNGRPIKTFEGIYYLGPGTIAIKEGGKWTFADTTGKRLSKNKYTDVSLIANGPVVIYNDKLMGFARRDGSIIIDAICSEYKMVGKGYIRLGQNNKVGLIGPDGTLILVPKYDGIGFVANGAMIAVQQGCQTIYVDSTGRQGAGAKIPSRVGCRIGFVDSTGKEIVKPIFDDYADAGTKGGYVQVMLNGKSGLINSLGEEVLTPKYNWINQSATASGYMQVKLGDKMGIIDTTGHEIITPEYESVFSLDGDLFAIKQNEKWGVIDINGNQKLPNEYETIATIYGDRILVKQNKKWGLVDTTGKVIVEPKYDRVDHTAFSKGMLPVREKRQLLLVDLNGRELLGDIGTQQVKLNSGNTWERIGTEWKLSGSATKYNYDKMRWYSSSMSIAYKDGKAGLVNAAGKEITPFAYDTVRYIAPNLACVVAGKKNGLVNSTGKLVLPVNYYLISTIGNGYCAVCEGEYLVGTRPDGIPTRYTVCHWGFADSTGKMVITPNYDDFEAFVKGYAPISLNKKQGLIDSTGRVVVEPRYDKITAFQGNVAFVKVDGKWGVIDRSGRELIEPTFTTDYRLELKTAAPQLKASYYPKFYKGYATVFNGRRWGLVDSLGKKVADVIYDEIDILEEPQKGIIALVKLKKKWGAIDARGNEVIKPKYLSLYQFTEGLARAIKGPKYGYIDATGNEVIPESFDEAGIFRNGWAIVHIAYRYFLVDTDGNPMDIR
ncbi:MAG: WG repeat-containing protein [Sphingobacteriales bacterium JAD_PAG50586_3]|nr:MAG: WG repeat-containing protein [Sphingobacteriales bacterium JAD_PAG50586_3]